MATNFTHSDIFTMISSRGAIEIIVAFISAASAICIAVISNWDKLFPERSQTTQNKTIPSPLVRHPYSIAKPNKDLRERLRPEVISTLQRYISNGKEAYWNLDLSLISKMLTGDALETLKDDIDKRQLSGERVDIESNKMQYNILTITENPLKTEVSLSRNVQITLYSQETKECIETTGSFTRKQIFYLQYQENEWKIYAIENQSEVPRGQPC
jgi:hypothetical protein